MTSADQVYVPNELLGRLVGQRLYSVEFVLDYLQLRFDSDSQDKPILNCDVMPVVVTGAGRFRDGQLGFADALRSLIAGIVVGTKEATGLGLVIDLDTGSVLVHPQVEDVSSPEIALLQGFEDGSWMCWRPGEESFEDLA